MVETIRCPNASYSALSTVPTLMPRRAALSRSMVTYTARPLSSWLLTTSDKLGLLTQARDELGRPGRERDRIRALERELVLRAADGVVESQVLHRLHVQRDARRCRSVSVRSRRMISLALSER